MNNSEVLGQSESAGMCRRAAQRRQDAYATLQRSRARANRGHLTCARLRADTLSKRRLQPLPHAELQDNQGLSRHRTPMHRAACQSLLGRRVLLKQPSARMILCYSIE
jgi:hypothetical protein